MIDITKYRSQFTIYVVDPDPQTAKGLSESISAIGYEAVFHPTLEMALAACRQAPPHLVLFNANKFESGAESFLLEIRSISEEIQSILMVKQSGLLQALQYVSRGLAYDSVTLPFVSTLELIQKMDRAALRLLYQFEAEQLREFSKQVARKSSRSGSSSKSSSNSVESSTEVRAALPAPQIQDVGQLLSRVSGTRELDQTIQHFMEAASKALDGVPIVYLKYMPSHLSLLLSQASMISADKYRGLGLDLKKHSSQAAEAVFRDPMKSPLIQDLVSGLFNEKKFSAFTHVGEVEPHGVFLVLGHDDLTSTTDPGVGMFQCLHQIFELAFRRNLTLKEKHAVDILDAESGLYNRRHFRQKIDEEISRSRRLLFPVSLVIFKLGGLKNLREQLGSRTSTALLRAYVQVMRQTTRTNDIVARVAEDEIACILAHTSHGGAAIKAERLRKALAGARIPALEQEAARKILEVEPIIISAGVSEYPSFSSDAESLVLSADDALAQVLEVGGNRVCLATVLPGFEMDFNPLEPVPGGIANREASR